jgi:hypothetical protein
MIAILQSPAGPLSLHRHLPERSSPSMVRCAAQKPRALDRSGPFRTPSSQEGKGAIGKDRRSGPVSTRAHDNTINQCYPSPPVTFSIDPTESGSGYLVK